MKKTYKKKELDTVFTMADMLEIYIIGVTNGSDRVFKCMESNSIDEQYEWPKFSDIIKDYIKTHKS